jgi:hypothetical protein
MFIALWLKMQIIIQWAIIKLRNERGLVPQWFLMVFDLLMRLMWFHHDYLHAPIFGKGN